MCIRDSTWWGDWTNAKGKRIQRSLRTKDKVVARERLRIAELAASDPAADRKSHTLGNALDYMINTAGVDLEEPTREMYRQKARHLVRLLGDPEVSAIERDH